MTAPPASRPSATAVHATSADLDGVAVALAASFADDPVQQWLFEPAVDADSARGRFFRFFVGEYFGLGHVYTVRTGDGDRPVRSRGAAMWAPPDRDVLKGDRVHDLISLVTELIGDDAIPRLTELGRAAEHRPPEPHFYLGMLGVDPGHQGRGLGAILVAPVLEACDRGGFVAHLESSNPRNLGFYRRLGFESVVDYHLDDATGPLMTIMRRTPR